MKKNKLLLFLDLFMLFLPIVNAGSFSVKSTDLSPKVGDTIRVTVTASNAAGKFIISSSDSSILSGGGSDWIENESKQFSFKANKAGNVVINIVPDSVADSATGDAITGGKSLNISVNNPTNVSVNTKAKSSINYLSSLSIEGFELKPGFDKNTTEYEVILPNGTTSVNVNGSKESSASYVNGLGNVSVSDGVNYISVVVTAENGAKKTYNIKATVLELEPILINVDNKDMTFIRKNESMPEASEYYTLSTVLVDGLEVPTYVNENTGFNLVALKDNDGNAKLYQYNDGKVLDYKEFGFNNVKISLLEPTEIPAGYTLSSLQIGEDTVSVYIKDDSYPLIYGINLETGEKNFYSYDSSENTIQKYVIRTLPLEKNYDLYIIIGLAVLCFIQFIIILKMIISKNKRLKKSLKAKLDKGNSSNTSDVSLDNKAVLETSDTSIEEKKSKKKNKKNDDMYHF